MVFHQNIFINGINSLRLGMKKLLAMLLSACALCATAKDQPSFYGERKVMALRLLFRSALNGDASAMQRMAAGSAHGWLGLSVDLASAACWSQAAAGARRPVECVGVTRFREESSRPRCDELVMMEDSRHKDAR
jgi:hypothetical protein